MLSAQLRHHCLAQEYICVNVAIAAHLNFRFATQLSRKLDTTHRSAWLQKFCISFRTAWQSQLRFWVGASDSLAKCPGRASDSLVLTASLHFKDSGQSFRHLGKISRLSFGQLGTHNSALNPNFCSKLRQLGKISRQSVGQLGTQKAD